MPGGPVDAELVVQRYLDHLTTADRDLLAAVAPGAGLLDALAGDPLYRAVFASASASGSAPARATPLIAASPFLAFAVAVHRTANEVARSAYVPEWTGPRQRLPIFDGRELTAFLAEPWHRLFLAELLASYAQVASGSYWTRTARGWRRRRWSELDPVRLAGLLDVVPPAERAGVYRRLGDLALFLTGVFPDHVALHGLGMVEAARLIRRAGGRAEEPVETPPVELLERLGVRWYRLAASTAVQRTAQTRLVAEIAEQFRAARRVLGVVADRHLFPAGNPWFPAPGR